MKAIQLTEIEINNTPCSLEDFAYEAENMLAVPANGEGKIQLNFDVSAADKIDIHSAADIHSVAATFKISNGNMDTVYKVRF